MPTPSKWALLVSALVRTHLHFFPIKRGKWRLQRWASPFLLTAIEKDLYVRVWDPDDAMERTVFLKGILEPRTTAVFLSLLRPGMCVMDVGANIGIFALLASRRIGPLGSAYAFEPTPAVAARLRKNVEFNRLTNITVVESAVGDYAGTLTFYLQESSDQNTLAANGGTPIQVEALMLDGFAARAGIEKLDVVKIDVEGAETRVLLGAERLLSGESAPVLNLEFNPPALRNAGSSVEELRGCLARHGYDCRVLESFAGGVYFNVLATKEQHARSHPHLQRLTLDRLA